MKKERVLLAALGAVSILFLIIYSFIRIPHEDEIQSETILESIIVEEETQTETETETEMESETIIETQTDAPVVQTAAPQTEAYIPPETQSVTELAIEAQTEPVVETESIVETEPITETEVEETEPVTETPVATTSDDQYLLAYVIWHEAGNQPYEGMQAVGIVVMNRVRSSAFPNTVYNVINQQNQFFPLSVATAKANYDWLPQGCKDAAAYALSGGIYVGSIDMSGMYFFASGSNAYGEIHIGGHYFRSSYR